MNIFEEPRTFLGEIHPEHMKNALDEFYEAVESIKVRLGCSGNLLNDYIEILFDAINEVNTETSSTLGFSECVPEFKRLCGGIVRGESGNESHPLYEQVKRYIYLHPLPRLERLNQIEVYVGALIGDFGKYAIEKYYDKFNHRMEDGGYISQIKSLYSDICGILGSEEPMEELNLIIKQHFIIVPVMHSFLQAVLDNILQSLSCKVPETAKHIFELVTHIETPTGN